MNFESILSPKKSFIFTLSCAVLYFAWFIALKRDFESIPEVIAFPACLFFSVYIAAFLYHVFDFCFHSLKRIFSGYFSYRSDLNKAARLEENASNILGHLNKEEHKVLSHIFFSPGKASRLNHFDEEIRNLHDLGFVLVVERVSGYDSLFEINHNRNEMIGKIVYPEYYNYVRPRFDMGDPLRRKFLSFFCNQNSHEILEIADEDEQLRNVIFNAQHHGFVLVTINKMDNCYDINLDEHFVHFLKVCSDYNLLSKEIKLRLV